MAASLPPLRQRFSRPACRSPSQASSALCHSLFQRNPHTLKAMLGSHGWFIVVDSQNGGKSSHDTATRPSICHWTLFTKHGIQFHAAI